MENNTKDIFRTYPLFFLEGLAVLFILFGGGLTFFKSDALGLTMPLPLGMLTFVSVFFGFVHSDRFIVHFNSFDRKIKQLQEASKQDIRQKTQEDFEPTELDESIYQHRRLTDLRKTINPLVWLYFSVFFYLFTIAIELIGSSNRIGNFLIDGKLFGAIAFHIGLATTFFLVTSVLSIELAHKRNFSYN